MCSIMYRTKNSKLTLIANLQNNAMSSQKLEHNTELCKCVTDTYQEAQNSQKIQTKICKEKTNYPLKYQRDYH